LAAFDTVVGISNARFYLLLEKEMQVKVRFHMVGAM
jgi:hypothetical protein